MENNGRNALITGATSGIGFELAKLFAKDQYNVIIVARDEAELQKCSSERPAARSALVISCRTGGGYSEGHRCPCEWVTVAALHAVLNWLPAHTCLDAPRAELEVSIKPDADPA